MTFSPSPGRILAVDDVEFNLDLLAAVFEEGEPHVELVRATNGQRALELLAETPGVDVVLLDLEMPGMSGYEVLEAVRAAPDESLRRIPILVLTANADEKTRALLLGANDFISKPFDAEELRLRCVNYLEIRQHHELLRTMRSALEEEVARRTADLAEALRRASHNAYEISFRLARASEYRDSDTGAHLVRMSRCSARLAELAGFPAAEVELILHSAPLHDVGKIGIDDAIMRKPGKLTPEEFTAMKRHTLLGASILADPGECTLVEAGRIIAEQHHEKWDGSGYPYGLVGEQIHRSARVVAICDVFDALISARVYKPALPVEQAVEILREGRGKHFDPALLDVFLGALDDFVEISRQHVDEG